MSMKAEYATYLKSREDYAKNIPMSEYFLENYDRYVEPFRIYGDLYYVGDSWVCVHLIDTGEGLLLLDAGNLGGTAMLIHSIWKLGFDPADIRWVIVSHGHLDHFGSVNFLKKLFGTEILLGAPDAEMLKERPECSFIHQSPNIAEKLFTPDRVIHDAETIRFGNLDVYFRLVPGHSFGPISCFFNMQENGVSKRIGFYGGFGFNTLSKEYLQEIGDTNYTMRETYLSSLKKVRNEKVELFIGNHTDDVNLLEKKQLLTEHPDQNPFLDSEAWGKYLDLRRDKLIAFMHDPANN